MRYPTKIDSLLNLSSIDIRTVVDVGVERKTESLMTVYPDAEHILIECDKSWIGSYGQTYAGIKHRAFCLTANDTDSRVDELPLSEGALLIKVDVDGPELTALKGCSKLLGGRTAIVVVEATSASLCGLTSYLESHDFQLFDIVELCYCGPQIHQCDLVFVHRTFSHLAFTPWDINKFQQGET